MRCGAMRGSGFACGDDYNEAQGRAGHIATVVESGRNGGDGWKAAVAVR